MSPEAAPIAIFPWGEVIEEFLDPLGLTAEDFANRMSGGWLFGYVAALARRGRRSFIVYASERVGWIERLIHAETGAAIWLVPARRSGEGLTRRWPSARALQQWRRTPLRAFGEVLRREGCGGVLIQDYEHARFDALVLLARSRKLPVFASFQGGDVTLSPLEARVRRRSLQACQAVIVASGRERGRLAERYGIPAARLLDIPNPVDGDLWRPEPRAAARATLGILEDAFLVVNHGRIDIRRKGLDTLLAAWRGFAASRPEARLVMIGSGQDAEAFAPLAAATPQLTWNADYVTDPGLIRRWLSAADAYITLSRLEGMPVAPLEAMACALPVVAADAHGLADIFADPEAGGMLVPRDDPRAATQALSRLYEDAGLRCRLAAQARARVAQRYSLDAVGERLDLALRAEPGAEARAASRVTAPDIAAARG